MPVFQDVITAVNTITNPSVVRVTWNNASFTNGASSYTLLYTIHGRSTWRSQVIQGGSVTSYDIENAQYGHTYQIYVIAVGFDGGHIRKTSTIDIVTHAGIDLFI